MHLSKAKIFKLALPLIALAFFVAILTQLNLISLKTSEVKAADPIMAAQDNCGVSAAGLATINIAGTNCQISTTTGFAGGDLNVTNGSVLTVSPGAILIIDKGSQIYLGTTTRGQIILQTAGAANSGIMHGSVCIEDDDQDGYANNGATYKYVSLDGAGNTQNCSVLNNGAQHFVAKSALLSTTTYDCFSGDPSKSSCCTNGYLDYDKDGDGAGSYGCYDSSASYNVSPNNYDCDDGTASVKNGTIIGTFCGVGGCGGTGSDTCTNGTIVHTSVCATSAKLCCDGTGNYKTAQTPISTCLKCNGIAADPVNQTALEDLSGLCATGALGSGTSCQAATCSGTGDTCGSLADNTTCNYGAYGAWTNPSGYCFATRSRNYYTCAAGTCSGTPAGTDYDVNQYATTDGNIWNGTSWVVANSSLYKSLSSPYTCSGLTSVIGSFYGCAVGNNATGSVVKGTTATGTTCSGTENNMCVAGNAACVNNCSSGGSSQSGSPYLDNQNSDCTYGGCSQCTSGTCCNTASGCYNSSATTCRSVAGTCDVAENCTGASAACPVDAFKTSAIICSAGTFNSPASGSCQRSKSDQYCAGTAAACTGSTVVSYDNAPTAGNVWNGSAWVASTVGVNCNLSGYTCNVQQIYRNWFGCNTTGTCDNVTVRGTSNGSLCTGAVGESASACVGGSSTCANQCSDTVDNDSNGYTDAQDTGCGGGGQCTSGTCCDIPNGRFKTSGTTCRASAGVCDIAETCTGASASCPTDAFQTSAYKCLTDTFDTPASGACQRTATDQYCTGTGASCNGSTVNRYENATSTGRIWNGSVWASSTATLYCGTSAANSCSTQQPQKDAYGCNTSGSCSTTANGFHVNSGTACSGAENDRCSSGVCTSFCSDGLDNDANGYTDAQDVACGGGGQCTSGACCNTANGSYQSSAYVCRAAVGTCNPAETCTGASTACPIDAVAPNTTVCSDPGCGTATSTAGSCTTSYNTQKCGSGTGLCNGALTPTTCYTSTSGTVWNGTSWVAASVGTNCNLSGYLCSAKQIYRNYYGCTTAGACTVSNVSNGTLCSTANGTEATSTCVVGSSTCVNQCSDAIDNDSDGYTDGQEIGCGGSGQCTVANGCCTVSTATYIASGTVCTVADAAIGACQISGFKCNATGLCNTAYTVNATTTGNIWNSSLWTAATCAISSSAGATYTCSGQTIQKKAYGCTTSGTADLTTAKATCTSGTTYPGAVAWTSTTCTGGENSRCAAGSATCANLCSDGLDNDADGYIDAQDSDCGGGSQCTSGTCCDIPNGRFLTAGTTCRSSAGACDIAETCSGASATCPTDAFQPSTYRCLTDTFDTPASGACLRTAHDQNCSGSAATCSGAIVPRYEYGTNNQVWNGASWVASSVSTNCSLSGYLCSAKQIYRNYYGCTTAGACSVSNVSNGPLCSTANGTEATSTCVVGTATCVNQCSDTTDNDSDGYIDGQDVGCGGCSQCTGSTCCTNSNGCYQASGTICSTATGSSGACQLSGLKCNTTGGCSTAYTVNSPTLGNIWNGSAWTAATASLYCGSGAPLTCSGNTSLKATYGCNTSGGCSTTDSTYDITNAVCSGGTPYCVSGNCVACTLASQCGTDGYVGAYSCSGQDVKRNNRVYSCTANACSFVDTLSTVSTCSAAYVCNATTGGCDARTCPAGQYVYINGSYSACANCGDNTLYTSSVNSQTSCTTITHDGYMGTGGTGYANRTGQALCTAGSWCCSGTICASCYAGYYCPAGTGYQTAPVGSRVYDHPCPAGYYCLAGQSSGTTNPCPAGSFCPAGSPSATTCYAGYYCPAGASDYATNPCPAGYYCVAGQSSGTTNSCPAGSYCPAGSSSALQCPAGYYCPAGSSTYTTHPCTAGYYCPAGSSSASLQCPAGYYCPSTTGSPYQCPATKSSPAGSTTISACTINTCGNGTCNYCNLETTSNCATDCPANCSSYGTQTLCNSAPVKLSCFWSSSQCIYLSCPTY
ncbi:MAG: hypothetical protein WCK59_04020 [Candidatus Falkowbacteria bacterium]